MLLRYQSMNGWRGKKMLRSVAFVSRQLKAGKSCGSRFSLCCVLVPKEQIWGSWSIRLLAELDVGMLTQLSSPCCWRVSCKRCVRRTLSASVLHMSYCDCCSWVIGWLASPKLSDVSLLMLFTDSAESCMLLSILWPGPDPLRHISHSHRLTHILASTELHPKKRLASSPLTLSWLTTQSGKTSPGLNLICDSAIL